MDNRDQIPPGKRSQFEKLVCEDGLGYCCPYALFRVTKETGKIATRLGMTTRTIRLWKAKFRSKEIVCEGRSNCLITHIRSLGK